MKTQIINWYERYERHVSSLAILGGFVFDALYLKRIDLFWENLWVVAHLLVAASGIIILNYYFHRTKNPEEEYRVYSLQFWLIFIIQFAFGGLLSTFLVFYFRSSTLSVSWPFLLLLVGAFIGNEAFKKHYARLSYQTSILFLSIFSFAIFIVPVILGQIGDGIFIYSGLISLSLISVFVSLLRIISNEHVLKNIKILRLSIFSIYFFINFLYFANIIPPIPLSIKEAGVYHSITRNLSGNYNVYYEAESWMNFFTQYEPINILSGDPVYIYTAVFSPANFDLTIFHEWQWYDTSKKTWTTLDRITLPIIGGRDGGYRTYSFTHSVFPGLWRVNVITANSKLIGRVEFKVKNVTTEPALLTSEI